MVIYIALNPCLRLNNFAKHGDFSYGAYLFAFPVQQLMVQRSGGGMEPMDNFIISLPIILFCAIISWHVIEKRALSLKNVPLPKFTGKTSMLVVLT